MNFNGQLFYVVKHFNSRGHNLSNIKFVIIEVNFKSPARRLLRKSELIILLGTNKADYLNKVNAVLSGLEYCRCIVMFCTN